MASHPAFRRDLYRGTAPFYDRYRPPYPEALFEDLRVRMPLPEGARILDLACGTGQVAFPLAPYAGEVVAVDQEPESVAFARDKARHAGIERVTWVTGSAESVELDGRFDLVAVGTAYQRLDRPVVARRMRSWLRPGGGVALLWSDMPWVGERPWERELEALFVAWVDRAQTADRVPAGWEEAMARSHADVLRDAGFTYEGKFTFVVDQTWTADSVIGFLYSTSLLNEAALGNAAGALEEEVRARLLPLAEQGELRRRAEFSYELALAPTSP